MAFLKPGLTSFGGRLRICFRDELVVHRNGSTRPVTPILERSASSFPARLEPARFSLGLLRIGSWERCPPGQRLSAVRKPPGNLRHGRNRFRRPDRDRPVARSENRGCGSRGSGRRQKGEKCDVRSAPRETRSRFGSPRRLQEEPCDRDLAGRPCCDRRSHRTSAHSSDYVFTLEAEQNSMLLSADTLFHTLFVMLGRGVIFKRSQSLTPHAKHWKKSVLLERETTHGRRNQYRYH